MEPIIIEHRIVPIVVDGDNIRFGRSKPNDNMEDPVELRYCLAALVPGIKKVVSFTLTIEGDANIVKHDMNGANWLYTMFHRRDKEEGLNLFGGTGLTQGVVYGVDWKDHPFTLTDESVGYLGLLMTPMSTRDELPVIDEGKVLVLSDTEFDKTGLVAGYGAMIGRKDIGQVRSLINGSSVGKGVVIGRKTCTKLGLYMDDSFEDYDYIISESDVKINPLKPGEYDGKMGHTWNNVHTVNGQEIGLGFEFWQMLKLDPTLMNILSERIAGMILPTYEEMLIGAEARRALAMHCRGEEYAPMELTMKLQEALLVLGAKYPWVAERLEKLVANYLMSKPFKDTSYRMVVVTQDWLDTGFTHNEEGTADFIGGKYPITAGLMRLTGRGIINNWMVLHKSTADRFNIDSDGDGAFTCDPRNNALFQYILDNDLIKESRDIDVVSRGRHNLPLTLENTASIAWDIYIKSAQIGSLTINYYLTEIANDIEGMSRDLSPFYRGIERVIKSAKHKMDMSFFKDINWKDLADLRKEYPMPYRKMMKAALMKSLNEGTIDIDDLKLEKVTDPRHYMDVFWNSTLDRVEEQVKQLRDGTEDFEYFGNRIGLTLMPESEAKVARFNDEVAKLSCIVRSYGNALKNDMDPATAVKFMTAAAPEYSAAAKRTVLRNYLKKVKQGSGSVTVHLGYGELGDIFHSVGAPEYVMDYSEVAVVRAFSTEVESSFDVDDCADIILDDYMLSFKDSVLEVGTEHANINLAAHSLVAALPAVSNKWNRDIGAFNPTKSVWLVLTPKA